MKGEGHGVIFRVFLLRALALSGTLRSRTGDPKVFLD